MTISYYPVHISPGTPVWEVDYRIRTMLGLPTIFPPVEYNWRPGPARRNAVKRGHGGATRTQIAAKLASEKADGAGPSEPAPVSIMKAWRAERRAEALEKAPPAPGEESERRRRKNKPTDKTKKPAAIIPCYVYPGFSRLEEFDRLKKFSDIFGYGIKGLLQWWNPDKHCFEYYSLKEHDIHYLLNISEGGRERATTAIRKSLTSGQKVVIKTGPFAGFTAQFDRRDREYAKVLLELFGRMNVVDVPMSDVEAA
jgi:hypothetical protein